VAETPQPLGFGVARPVNVAEAESELASLWRSVAEDGTTRQALMRACALTLLVYVESEEAGREVSGLIGRVTPQNPCRAVVTVAQPEASPAGLTAWISGQCHLPISGEKQLCCEQVTVVARGEAVRDLDNVVVPLVVPGLPVVLWWRASQFAPPAYFRNILRVTNRVLVDSARFPVPEADLANLSEHVHRLAGEVTFSDLNWSRMTPWRELAAQCFDVAESRGYLDRLSCVRIEYEQESARLGAQATQALLLAGWLAGRLRWEPEKGGARQSGEVRSFFFKSAHGPVEVQRIARRYEGGGRGVCFSITMKAAGDPPATFVLERGPDGRKAAIRREISGQPPIEGAVRLEVLDEVELMNEEMRFASRDRIYEEALHMVAQMTAL
jgi:glucose-6-phosphate dehydrogenase assembly protein OpcA